MQNAEFRMQNSVFSFQCSAESVFPTQSVEHESGFWAIRFGVVGAESGQPGFVLGADFCGGRGWGGLVAEVVDVKRGFGQGTVIGIKVEHAGKAEAAGFAELVELFLMAEPALEQRERRFWSCGLFLGP